MKTQEIHTVGEVFNGKTPSSSEQRPSGFPILKIRDIDENGKFRGPFESFVDQEFYNKYPKKKLKAGDTIILNAAHNSDYVGSKNAFVTNELNGVIATGEWLIVRAKGADHAYVNHFLKSPVGRKKLKKCVKGIHLYPKDVEKIKIPIPNRNDQIHIALLLSKVEEQITQRKRTLQQLDELLKSIFLETFGDPIRNSKGFPVKRLSEFYINPKDGTKCGPFGSALKKYELVESGIPVWNMDNIDPSGRMILPFRMWITKDKYQELRSYSVIDGDIIISRAGTVGKMCVAKMNGLSAIISTNLIRLRLGPKLLPLHVVSLMTYCKGRVGRLKTGADGAFTHMNTGILDKLEFPYPPIELQKLYASIAEKVEGIKSRYQQSLSEFENLYGALSQKAFKGELDLSRVPHEPLTIRDDKSLEVGSTTIETPFEASDKLTISSPEGRIDFLKQCFTNWLAISSSGNFSFSDYLKEVQLESIRLLGEEDFIAELTLTEYDLFKEWLFEAIDTGQVEQTRNTIEVDGKPDFGNKIVLTRRDCGN